MPYIELTNRAEMVAAVNGEPGVYSLIYCHEGVTDELADKTASEQSSDPVKAYSVDVTKNPKATDFLFIHQSPSPVVFRDGKDFIYLEVVRRDESSLSTIKFLNIPRRLSSASKTKYAKVLQSVARLQIFELVLYL